LLIGAATMRGGAGHPWTAAAVFPPQAAELAELRNSRTGKSDPPPLAILTASGDLPSEHPALTAPPTPVLVLTTEAGAVRAKQAAPNAQIIVCGDGPRLAIADVIAAVDQAVGPQMMRPTGMV
jgi:hypothetical protein